MTHIPSEAKTVSPSIVMPGGSKGTLSFSHTYLYTHIYTYVYVYNRHTIRGEDSFAINSDAGGHEGHTLFLSHIFIHTFTHMYMYITDIPSEVKTVLPSMVMPGGTKGTEPGARMIS